MGWPVNKPPSGIARSGIPATSLPKGHTVTIKSGAQSPRVYGPLAEALLAGLLDEHPDLAAYPGEVAAWARAEARAMLMDRWLAENGHVDADGKKRDAVNVLTSAEREAARARAALGLTPFAEAALAKERASAALVSVDLAAIEQRGRRALAAREAAGIETPDTAGEILGSVLAKGRETYVAAVRESYLKAGLEPPKAHHENAEADGQSTESETDR